MFCINHCKIFFIFQDENLKFKEVWVNCMSLNQSTNIYQKIASQISKEVPSCRDSEKFLEKIFQSKGCKMYAGNFQFIFLVKVLVATLPTNIFTEDI